MMLSPIRDWFVPVLFSFALASGTCPALAQGSEPGRANPLSEALVPNSTFSPSEVVRIQIEALRHNDEQDRGIAVAFRFASPANRANTGPLTRFIAMLKEGPYALMLGFRDAAYGPMETMSAQARQRVTLTGTRESVTYWFYLSRQSEAPYVDCWMTDAVLIEPDQGRVA